MSRMSSNSSQNSGWNKSKRHTASEFDVLEDFITEKPHQFPGTKVNPEFVPEEGLDLEGMEDPFGLPWDVI